MLLFSQQTDSIIDLCLECDSLAYQIDLNSFSLEDETTLYGYNPLFRSSLTNFGAPIVGWYWEFDKSTDLRIGDRILEFARLKPLEYSEYKHTFAHTKIIYAQAYSEGQRLSFSHINRHKYGSFQFEYDQLVSKGFMLHEKNKYSNFTFQTDYTSPKIPYKSVLRVHVFKNTSEWNAGLREDSLFLSDASINWELLPVNWTNLNSNLKHKALEWRHTYHFSEASKLEYDLNLSQDSLFYEGLNNDSLFYPTRLDSSVYTRAITNVMNSLKWSQKLTNDKRLLLGVKHQSFKSYVVETQKLSAFTSVKSDALKNELYFEFGKEERNTHTLKTYFKQKFSLKKILNEVQLSYTRNLPNLMFYKDSLLNFNSNPSDANQNLNPIVNQSIEWSFYANQNLKFTSTYHNISGFTYFNEKAMPMQSAKTVQVFQSRVFHHLNWAKWHWLGDAVYQNSSSKNLPLSTILLNQKVYWQGVLFKKAAETQIGFRALYRSSHPGMSFAPLFGDFYRDPESYTDQSIRLDAFVNLKIKSIKIYAAYEHFNSLFQGVQYILKPYPMAKPTFRLSLVWNFYD